MIELSVNIKGREKSYPIHINNADLDKLKNAILEEIHYKNYIVVISQKVFKLYFNNALSSFDRLNTLEIYSLHSSAE